MFHKKEESHRAQYSDLDPLGLNLLGLHLLGCHRYRCRYS